MPPHLVGRADGVEGMAPDPPPGGAGRAFEGQHLRNPDPVVGKDVDPRHAEAQHLALHPKGVARVGP